MTNLNLRHLEIAIENGTYNLEENHMIGNDGQGRGVLTSGICNRR